MNVAPRTKVTWPTGPWLAPHSDRALWVHVQSYYTDDRRRLLALCDTGRWIAVRRPDLPRCPVCVNVLRSHGLWPLEPP